MTNFLTQFLIILFVLNVVADTELTIIHTNDIHARISQSSTSGDVINDCTPETEWDTSKHSKWFHGCHGGAARRKTVIDQLRKDINNTLVMDAGDQFQGTLWYSLYKGDATAWVTNAIQYDVLTLGNHEFDDGDLTLKLFLEKLTPNPMLCANIDIADDHIFKDTNLWMPHKVFTMNNGKKVGVIGYTHPQTHFLSTPGQGLTFIDPKIAVQREADILKEQGVDIIIAVGHLGFELDKEMAQEVDGIDIIIGGHTDTFCYTGDPTEASPYAYPTVPHEDYPVTVTGPSGKTVCIAQDYTFGTWLGKMDIIFDDNGDVKSCGGNPIFMDGSTIEQDPDVLEWSIEMYDGLLDSYSTKIGVSFQVGYGLKPESRKKEVSLANLYTDALVIMMNRINIDAIDENYKEFQIALMNGGALRANLPKGDITVGDITSISPFNNNILTLKDVPVFEIVNIIEYGLSKVEYGEGRFPHWSGIRYEYDPEAPALSRLVKAEIICAPGNPGCNSDGDMHFIDLMDPGNANYKYDIITNSYLANGGDGYDMLPQYHDGVGGLFTETDLVVEYLKHFSPIQPHIDGRIKIVSTPDPSSTVDPNAIETTDPESGTNGLFAAVAVMLSFLSLL